MEETAERILEILQDYHCDFPATKYEMSVEHITKWANQFEDDAAFVLSELLHFLPQIYISKSKAIELLNMTIRNLYLLLYCLIFEPESKSTCYEFA